MTIRLTLPSRRLGVILSAALAVAASVSLATPTDANATTIVYALDDVSATFGALGSVSYTGSFVFNTTTDTVSSAAITATGPVPPLAVSPAALDIVVSTAPVADAFAVSDGVDDLESFGLAASLKTDAPYRRRERVCGPTNRDYIGVDHGFGGASPGSAIGFGVFGACGRDCCPVYAGAPAGPARPRHLTGTRRAARRRSAPTRPIARRRT
jgi:hypothetical protein